MTFAINGKADIFFMAARIGQGNTVVDNFHAGGLTPLIDMEKGPLIIEGNRGTGWDLVQILLNKGIKYMLKKIKQEMKKHSLW